MVAGAPRMSSFDVLGLSVLSHAVSAIAEEMGTVLERGALSPNIRERRDASSAIFDADGAMVAQAAHIPVHLGAIPESVRAVRACDPAPGDVFILNDPYQGGSHLPDLTLVEAVGDGALIGYAAVRAHHSDVGGMSPGSMPQGATELVQEGLIIPPTRLATAKGVDESLLRLILANVRTPDERRGDLRAQLAACAAGAAGWRALHARQGSANLRDAVRGLLDYTQSLATARLRAMEGASGRAIDRLEGDGVSDDDVLVSIEARVDAGRLILDFAGTSPMVRGNVNCPIAVTRAAAVFVLRTLLPPDVPTNDGISRVIDLVVPDNCAVDARWPAAVAAGNVEMSQRITDTLFLALADAGVDVIAQGQGTMNNVTFGGDGWTFYETIGGGQGAGRHGSGPSGVHVGMSNTRITPIESLEAAYPLRIDEYRIARGTGGAGEQRGGDGVVRRYRALQRCTVTLLTERRRYAPQGAGSGGPGRLGQNQFNGRPLPAKCRVELQPGDVLTIQTPGGGGWGPSAI